MVYKFICGLQIVLTEQSDYHDGRRFAHAEVAKFLHIVQLVIARRFSLRVQSTKFNLDRGNTPLTNSHRFPIRFRESALQQERKETESRR